MTRRAVGTVVVFGVLALTVPPAGAADIPQWLLDAASLALPGLSPETEAVVLLDEQNTRVGADGTIFTSSRRAVRVLRQGGIDEARRLIRAGAYNIKVRSMNGWNLTEGRKTLRVTIKDVVETGLAPDTLYSDVTMKILSLPSVEVGSVVGFEWTEERAPESLEDIFEFQGSFPILTSRYTVSMPPGWTAEPIWVNWKPQEGQSFPGPPPSTVWEIGNVPAIESEPLMPSVRSLSGRLVIKLKPSLPDRRSFAGWADVGAWYEGLSKDCRAPDAQVGQEAQRLTAKAPDTLAKLRALAEFAQKEIRYVAVEIGIGGYKPHLAPSILSNRYGDCKDKATLLAALLESAGVASHYVLVHTNRGRVTAESPASLYSFNHVVLAIRLPADVPEAGMPAAILHPRLGRLLVFDPTSPYTALGHLPYYLQGNMGVIVADGGGELLPLPLPPPESNLLERRGHFALGTDGGLDGEVVETRRGMLADSTRHVLLNSTNAERTKYVETFLANFFAGFTLVSNEVKDLGDNSRDLVFSYRFRVPGYAKSAGGMLILRPRVLGDKKEKLERNDNRPRRYPLDLQGVSEQRDEFTIELAEGFKVEGLPPATGLDPGFAAYESRTEENGRSLVYRRKYRVFQPVLPADRFGEAVKFFRAMDADQRQSVLLKKQ
jgi:hypothetical protein